MGDHESMDLEKSNLMIRALGSGILFFLFFLFIAALYLWPAPEDVLLHHKVLGPGHDETLMPFYFAWIRKLFWDDPISLLNGTIWLPQISAPLGAPGWIPYIERVIAIVTLPFASDEQVSLYSTLTLLALNGLTGTILGRLMKLRTLNALTMGLCLSITPFTLWRSKIHLVLAGVYVVNLLGIYFYSIRRARHWSSALGAALILLLTLSGAHYLIFVILTLLPVVVGLVWRDVQKNQRKFLILSLLPFCVGLFWIKTETFLGAYADRPAATQMRPPIPLDPHRSWGLIAFAARPLDYFSGYHDPAAMDFNPLRKKLSLYLSQKEQPFHPEERSSGIRWILWVAFLLALFHWKRLPDSVRPWARLGLALAVVSYVFSLSSRSIAPLGIGMGPSRWVHALIPEMRSPNRWSVGVTLGITCVAFSYFSLLSQQIHSRSSKKAALASVLFFALCFLEFPPTLAHPTRTIEPRIQPPSGPCGRGVFLPYYSADDSRSYHSMLQLRGTDCEAINMQTYIPYDRKLKVLLNDMLVQNWERSQKLLECYQIRWAIYDRSVLPSETCKNLGMIEVHPGFCKKVSDTLLMHDALSLPLTKLDSCPTQGLSAP